MARHYRRIAFANLPFPPLWFEGGYLNFKKAREGLIGHPANMRREPPVFQPGTLPQSNRPAVLLMNMTRRRSGAKRVGDRKLPDGKFGPADIGLADSSVQRHLFALGRARG
jgi:hypothetical protein